MRKVLFLKHNKLFEIKKQENMKKRLNNIVFTFFSCFCTKFFNTKIIDNKRTGSDWGAGVCFVRSPRFIARKYDLHVSATFTSSNFHT